MPTSVSEMQSPQLPPGVPRQAPQMPEVHGVPVAAVPVPIEALQAQAAALVRQLAGLEVQSRYLRRQGDGDGDVGRAQIEANRASVDVQIAQARADLDNVRAQIAARANAPLSRVGETGQIVPPPPPRENGRVDPELVVGLSFTLLMAIVIPLSIAYARRIWRGKQRPVGPAQDEIAPRLARLEQAVDAIAIEVERISEGQRFVTKILADRGTASARGAPMEGALSEGQPLRALGAGPMEPVRMAERQAVRQTITPH